jgi:hypothetical protein
MKHYSTYVVHTTTKPKYIHVAHTTLREALQYSTYVVHTTTKPKYIQARHTGTASSQARLRNGTPKFRPSPDRPRSAPRSRPVNPEAPAAGAPRARHCAWGRAPVPPKQTIWTGAAGEGAPIYAYFGVLRKKGRPFFQSTRFLYRGEKM